MGVTISLHQLFCRAAIQTLTLPYPQTWQDYDVALRAIVQTSETSPLLELPTTPAYP